MPKTICIAGGGVAGLTLGLALLEQSVPVTVFEAGSYPRHRVCGEFIHGGGLLQLHRLGLQKDLENAGARTARSVAFFSGGSQIFKSNLKSRALTLSRFALDALLAVAFEKRGGALLQKTRLEKGSEAAGSVMATGREPAPARVRARRFVGLKAHIRSVSPVADLEMHCSRGQYIGLCGVENDAYNVCGLFQMDQQIPQLKTEWQRWLRGPAGSALHDRLADGTFEVETFCSVAGLPFSTPLKVSKEGNRIGDSFAMMAPISGNGLSMAIESACAAAPTLADFSRGKLEWADALLEMRKVQSALFQSRLRWARLVQLFMLSAGSSAVLLRSLTLVPGFFRTATGLTR